MKRLSLITINIFWIAIQLMFAQSNNQNYIKTITCLNETGSDTLRTIQYYDGLGRPVQTVQAGITPNRYDLVSYQEYDSFGRDSTSWLPRVKSGNNGNFVDLNTFKSLSTAIYQNDSKPYSLPVYEPSPLNRVIKQFGPGESWYSGNGHPVLTDYKTNSLTDNALKCIYFYVSGDNLVRSDYYAAGQLYVTDSKDEDGYQSYQFTDKLGRVVLTRQLLAATATTASCVDTYYVYDDFGNLRFVIPPMAVDALTGNGTWTEADSMLKKYAYLYRYDERQRCIAKRIPGCDWQYMVYDKADRLILSQDGEQRLKGQWIFNKYDDFGRVIISGIYPTTASHASLCAQFKNMLIVETYSQGNNYGYTWNTAPVVTTDKVLTVNYYDDYNRLLDQSSYFRNKLDYETKSGYGERYINSAYPTCSAKGLLTGSIAKMLDGLGEIVTALYYDERNRIVQKKSTVYQGGINREYIAYTFTDQIRERYIEYEGNVSVCSGELNFLSEHYEYEYDHANRLKKTTLNGRMIEYNIYNELGQLQSRQQGDTFFSNYTYNVRGWLKSHSESITGFQQTLFYEDIQHPVYKAYNGNISGMNYQYTGYPASSPLRTCYYGYDGLNRLTDSNFPTNQYDIDGEYSYYYDKHGNPASIFRMINGSVIDMLTISYNGNQKTNIFNEYGGSTLSSGYPGVTGSLTYNQNGAVISDTGRGIATIRYNMRNLPDTVQFTNGNAIYYTYDGSGMKLQTKHITVKPNLASPITVAVGQVRPLTQSETQSVLTTDYIGNNIIENSELKMILFPGGYIRRMMVGDPKEGYDCLHLYHYYLKDYLGNNRDVIRSEDGAANWTHIQRTEYTPFGVSFQQKVGDAAAQSYKFGGKEIDRMYNLNYYDFQARFYDPSLTSFLTIDPLAEKYPGISPYAYCANNPVRNIDPDGKSTYVADNKDGTYTVVGGKIDGDKSIYILYGENKMMGFLGESLTEYSFFDDNGNPVAGAIIDPKDTSGATFLNTEIIGTNLGLGEYMWNGFGGRLYDFKERGINYRRGSEMQYRYRGMPVNGVTSIVGNRGDGVAIYASARDIGNVAAGYMAGRIGLLWDEARFGFDLLETLQNGLIPTREGIPTQQAQLIGYNTGYAIYWMNNTGTK